jgi:hypothetical protein
MRQDDPSVRIIYDEWGVITPLVQQKGKKEKISKPKIKKFKNVDCNSGWRSDPDDEVYCSTPEEIVAQCKNVNLSEKGRQLRKMVYKTKTGNSLGKCLRE